MSSKLYIVLHHTGDSSLGPQFNKVYAYHNAGAGGKWPKGHGIQYHWFIGRDGTTKQGNAEDTLLWHAGSYHYNEYGIGICLAGDFTCQKVTPQQEYALTALVSDVQKRWGIKDGQIKLHREVRPTPTECPGIDLRAIIFQKRPAMGNRLLLAKEAEIKATGPKKGALQRLISRLEHLAVKD